MNPKADIKPEKKDYVKSLSNEMSEAKSVVFVDYTGMGVEVQQDLRAKIKEAGGTMKVVKNTLLQLAGKKAQLPEEVLTDEVLSGQTALVIANEDSVAPIQSLGKFIKEFELPKFKAGIVEGAYQDAAGLDRVSKLPTKDELSAQALGAISAPLYGLVGTLNGNLQKLVYILDQASRGGGENG